VAVKVREHLSKYAYSSDLLGARTVAITVGVVCLALYILANFTSRFAWIVGTVILGMVNARMIVVFHDANHGRPVFNLISQLLCPRVCLNALPLHQLAQMISAAA
jgi:fatty acid desaturase